MSRNRSLSNHGSSAYSNTGTADSELPTNAGVAVLISDVTLPPSAVDPTQTVLSNALAAGMTYFNTASSKLRIYDGSAWNDATTTVEGVYDVTEFTGIATETTIAIVYDIGLVQVLLNGVQLANSDFTATTGTNIVLAMAVTNADDIITVIRWGAVTTSTFLGTAATLDTGTAAGELPTNADLATGAFTTVGTAATKNTGVTAGTLPFAEDVVLIQPSGNVGIGDAAPSSKLTVYDTASDEQIKLGYSSTYEWSLGRAAADGSLVIKGYNGASSTDVAHFSLNGNVGIGRVPVNTLRPSIELKEGGSIFGYNNQLHVAANLYYDQGWKAMATGGGALSVTDASGHKFYTSAPVSAGTAASPDEKMRLDSSGNLLVGTTNVDNSDQGIELRNDGRLFATATSSSSAFNRKTTDGDILQFAKDSVTVGSIGTIYGYTKITSGDGANGSGLFFGAGKIYPVAANSVITDNAIDIGDPTLRFKDLHLSGGVVFGTPSGSASSNTLDDYEEGTWTPYIDNATLTVAGAGYTKVGRLVTVQAYLQGMSIPNTTDGFYIKGLPFPQASAGGTYGAGQISYCASGNLSGTNLLTHPSATTMYMHYIDGTSQAPLTNAQYLARNSTGLMIFQMTYMSN